VVSALAYETRSVRPEPVEGLSFSSAAHEEGQGFDKLSPNGVSLILRCLYV
jgi:hypothetical protein